MTDTVIHHTTFVIERVYDASVARVYAAFSEPGPRERWFVKGDGFAISEYDYDFRAGTVTVRCADPAIALPNLSLDLEVAEAIATAATGDKLLGWPSWVQGVEYPRCPRCNQQMSFVFQIDHLQTAVTPRRGGRFRSLRDRGARGLGTPGRELHRPVRPQDRPNERW